ncbi:MAG TPA: SusC/RagA family TonB-linked outer membrane protein [Longimicrobiaceae bacterium]|nr:SusC/RagA family TonB-linked outer membrane protein [Longimicrobiaceae bacterium]
MSLPRKLVGTLSALALLAASALPALAQQATITGTVTAEATGRPLPGVRVTVEGSRASAQTDATGRYTLTGLSGGTYTVTAQAPGYASQSRGNVRVGGDAGASATVDFRLRASVLEIEELVVTGVTAPTAGTKVPFAVGRVSAERLPVPTTGAAATALQGKVAGVQVLRGTGQPGNGAARIVLRSPSSIRKSIDPLYVVDGVILGSNPADITALDIESIEVIKGAAAASLYGSRAANGVIQIRTARGSNIEPGRTRITARSEYGQSEIARMIPLNMHHHYSVDPATGKYVDASGREVPRSLRFAPTVAFSDKPFPDPVQNPVESFFRPGSLSNNSVTLGQNTASTNFFLSFHNTRETGVLREHDGYRRNSIKLNLDHRLRTDLQLGVSAYHMRSSRDELAAGTFEALVQMSPDVDLRAPNANGQPFIVRPDPLTTQANPLYLNMTRDERNRRAQTMLGGELRYSPLDWLSFDGNVSYDRLDVDYLFYLPLGTLNATTAPSTGSMTRSRPINDAFNASAGASLQREFGNLTARLTGRALIERQNFQGFSTSTTNLRLYDVPQLQTGSAPNPFSSDQQIRSNGYFVTLGTDYADKLILDGLIRRDGSSLFGAEEQYNTYYRVSGAYRMADEPWWPLPQVNEFKLRYSRGTAGNRPSYGDRDAILTLQTDASQSNFGTLNKSTLGNPFLRPEHSTEQEFGVDVVAWNNLSVQLTYSDKVTTDQLHNMPVVAAYGFPSQWRNVGTLEGSTLEGSIEAQVLNRDDLKWRIGLVGDRSRFNITEWDAPCVRLGNSFLCEGERMGSIYGIKILNRHSELPAIHANSHNQFQVNDDGWLVPVGAGGSLSDPRWGTTVTIDGRNYAWGMPLDLMRDDGTLFGPLQIGDGNPDFHLGFTNTVTWRGLTLYTLLDSEVGADLYNDTRSAMYNPALGVRHGDGDQSGKAPENKKPVSYYSTLYHGFATTSAFIEDGTYLKLREVALRYDVGGAAARRLRGLGVGGASLSLIGRNLITWTNYKGFDPEVGQLYNGDYSRIDTFGYPNYRTYTAAVELQF